MSIKLLRTKRTDERLLNRMKSHYSRPKGFVGRSLCYAVYFDKTYFGHIVAGSATRFLPNRNEFLEAGLKNLNNVINNIFFNVSPSTGKYPLRNFTSMVVREFTSVSKKDWQDKYGDFVLGFETLVEKPRSGDLYKKAGWSLVGETKGYTCKRVAGKGTDSWSGKRTWVTDKNKLRPKLVFCFKLN
jgi:hypothetical protein